MERYRVQFEVDCDMKLWITTGKQNQYLTTPKYRIYANNELITERTWIWQTTYFLDEMFWIEVNSDTVDIELTEHWLAKNAGSFKISNIRINEKPATFTIKNNKFNVKLK